jgi:hypothetical protein
MADINVRDIARGACLCPNDQRQAHCTSVKVNIIHLSGAVTQPPALILIARQVDVRLVLVRLYHG